MPDDVAPFPERFTLTTLLGPNGECTIEDSRNDVPSWNSMSQARTFFETINSTLTH